MIMTIANRDIINIPPIIESIVVHIYFDFDLGLI